MSPLDITQFRLQGTRRRQIGFIGSSSSSFASTNVLASVSLAWHNIILLEQALPHMQTMHRLG